MSRIAADGDRLSRAHDRTNAVPIPDRIAMNWSATASQPAEWSVVMSWHSLIGDRSYGIGGHPRHSRFAIATETARAVPIAVLIGKADGDRVAVSGRGCDSAIGCS
jgi:hypothetical protein